MTNGTRRGWGVSVTPRPLFTPEKDPVPIVQEAGWAPGPVWTGVGNLAPTGIRSPDRPTRIQSLYWLSYRDPFIKKTKNTFLIDTAVPNTHNIAKTITDKQNKYQELANEICAMWKQNTAQVIPLVISSTAVIPKSLSQSLKRLNLHPNTYIQMQKSVILGTCSIVRNFLNYK